MPPKTPEGKKKALANLIPIKKGQLAKEDIQKRASNGGKKSAQVQKERKTMQEIVNLLLSQKAPDSIATKVKDFFPSLNKEEINVQTAILHQQVGCALKGDLHAVVFLRDTVGEKPEEKSVVLGEMRHSVTTEDIKKQGDKITSLMKKIRHDRANI